MSPRAAWRLESLGFTDVYDYVPGKADWFAAGLPRAGRQADVLRAGDAAERDAAWCGLSDRVGEVAARVRAAGQDECQVLNKEGVVLGRLRAHAFDGDQALTAAEVMESGPTTIRPDMRLTAIAERLRRRNVPRILVTTSEGMLVGTLALDEVERRLAEDAEGCLCGDDERGLARG